MFQFIYQCSPLEKIFEAGIPSFDRYHKTSALLGEEVAFQIAMRASENLPSPSELKIPVESDLGDIEVCQVINMPVFVTSYSSVHDEGYLSEHSGHYPDLLKPVKNGSISVSSAATSVLWFNVKIPYSCAAGEHKVNITLTEPLTKLSKSLDFTINVIGAVLPKNKLPITMWFHNDCIADVHGVEILSEEHWALIEKYMQAAIKSGVNMIYTPLFTPPLDTQVGCERPTVQLVDVCKDGGSYTFSFEKLDRYIALAQKMGFEYFELSHLFTQWGATHAPKIIATENGEQKKIFGWDTDLHKPEYSAFLDAFLPLLTEHLKTLGIAGKTYFHISDEPHLEMLEDYSYAHSLVAKHLDGFTIMDALSNFDFYQKGVVKLPVVATTAIEPFLDSKADIFCYYCCNQKINHVSNRMLAMPSPRNRMLAYQMFYNDVKGFLQWGFNFYYSELSKDKINPFRTPDANKTFPAGDSFVVYPNPDDQAPWFSISGKVFLHSMQDLRAMQLLESLIGTDAVKDILKGELYDLSFTNSTQPAYLVLRMREKINARIKAEIE